MVDLAQLREPLLIRGYFSAQTHPLLAPLVSRLRDLLEEYAVAGSGRSSSIPRSIRNWSRRRTRSTA